MTTRIAPDGILAQKNYKKISVADIAGDPSNPTGLWAQWDKSGDTEVLAKFPPPPTNPSGTQVFEVLIRKAGGPGGRKQAWQLELWENKDGVLVLSYDWNVDLPEEGLVVSGSFDASILTDPTGSQVQCKMRQVLDGAYGPPKDRRSIEVGGMVWVMN